jgi:hypothetical protein
MANPVNGRVTLTVDVAAGAETGWKASQKAIQDGVKTALEAIEIKGVAIDAANLDFTTSLTVIEPKGDGPEPDDSEKSDNENPDNDAAEGDGETSKKEKKSKKDKGAKAGKKKGRK